MRFFGFSMCLLMAACTGNKDDPDTECSESSPESCLYATDTSYEVQTHTVSINDTGRIGGTRQIALNLYEPATVESDLPTLFLTPGAPLGTGQNPAAISAENWAQTMASAGYLVIVVDLRGRSETGKQALCDALEIEEEGCTDFRTETWDAPKDVTSALNWLRSDQADNQWRTRTENAEVGHVGQEMGASTSLMLAGANRAFGSSAYDFTDNRIEAVMPIALVGNNNSSDFLTNGIENVGVPTYLTGGVNGYQSSNLPIDTPDAFSNLPAGDKYLLHFLDEDASIGTFHLDGTTCGECESFVSWVKTSSLAFADGILKNDAEAITWLGSENMNIVAGIQAEWYTR